MFRRPDPALFAAAPERLDVGASQSPGSLRYLGTAGFVLEVPGRTIVLDPFVTRPGAWRTLFAPLRSDPARVAQYLPEADDVLVGHAHHDHVLDAPELCRQTGARLIGSRDVANVGRAAGLPEAQLLITEGREVIPCGPVSVRGLPSRHGKVYGRVPFKGRIDEPPGWPARLRRFRHGQVLSWHLEAQGLRVVHVDSADYIDAELEGLRADVLCLCAIGWQARPSYVEAIVEALCPRYVIPCHWDWFLSPLSKPTRQLPGVDLRGFGEAITRAGAEPVFLQPLSTWVVPGPRTRPLIGEGS